MSKSLLVVCIAILTFLTAILAVNAPGIYSIGHAVGIFCCVQAAIVIGTFYKMMK